MKKYIASCHCGSVELELNLPNGIVDPRRCNCSMCRRKGAIVASVNLNDIHVIKGKSALKMYQFNSNTAKHYFCGNCGIHTHHQRRSNPNQYAFNLGCLENFNPFELINVSISDGINHPADRTQ